MPPRNAPQKRAQGPPGSKTAGGPGRSSGTAREGLSVGLPSNADHVKAIGVKRPGFGTAGRKIPIVANAYNMTLPESFIYHYDVAITTPKGTTDKLPVKFNLELIKELQTVVRPDIFTPEGSYDGRKNMYTNHKLNLGDNDTAELDIPQAATNPGRPPRIFKARLTLANTINPETSKRYIQGKQSRDEDVSTAQNALHVAVRMDPLMRLPSYGRSFFTEQGKRPIGGGLELWRGYFQAMKASIGRMLLTVDISTGVMYKPGPLIPLCLEFITDGKQNNPLYLSFKRGFPEDKRRQLQAFLIGLRVVAKHSGGERAYTVKRLSKGGASELKFTKRDGSTQTVADYFRRDLNNNLRYPDLPCIEVGSGALIPIELCTVPQGQIFKGEFPKEKTTDMVRFSTMKPADRFDEITRGLNVLALGQSQYIRDMGFQVDTSEPISLEARVLSEPKLKYGLNSKQREIQPKDGVWNMVDKTFFKPASIKKWVIVVYESESYFNMQTARRVVKDMLDAFARVGIQVEDKDPLIKWENGGGVVENQLLRAGVECKNQKGAPPDFMVVVLPEGAPETYRAVKHFGDVKMGIATQCLKSKACTRANEQYWANVMLKVNAKLGGVNAIPDPASVASLVDPRTPTIIIGADAIHPAPGATDRPSYTSVVGSVDLNVSHYIATSRVQASGKRRDIIVDLKEMCIHILSKHIAYRDKVEKAADPRPKRVIFYRDGVSEGEFQQVIDDELPLLREACEELKIQATITLIVTVKRHHTRFKPKNPKDGDRKTGNCPAGTIVDSNFGSPLEYDFFLLSHAAIQGTSRPTYYIVLHDDYGFKPDAIQSITFTLCHVYARCTRSVSIPAPVYYADIVCSRAKNHYDMTFNFNDMMSNSTDAQRMLENYKKGFKPLHAGQVGRMYFM